MLRLPNKREGYERLTVNHLRRLRNSRNRQLALLANTSRAGQIPPYNGPAVTREIIKRRNIEREVGMTERQMAPYYEKWMRLTEANNRKRGTTRQQRVNAKVRQVARAFKNTLRTHAMIGQLGAASVRTGNRLSSIPPGILHMIARQMRRGVIQTP